VIILKIDMNEVENSSETGAIVAGKTSI